MSISFSVTDAEMYTIFIIFIANILYNTFYADVWRHMFFVLKSSDLCAIFTFALFYLLPIYLFLIFSLFRLLLLYCSHALHTMNVSVSSLRLFLLFSGSDVFQFQPKFR